MFLCTHMCAHACAIRACTHAAADASLPEPEDPYPKRGASPVPGSSGLPPPEDLSPCARSCGPALRRPAGPRPRIHSPGPSPGLQLGAERASLGTVVSSPLSRPLLGLQLDSGGPRHVSCDGGLVGVGTQALTSSCLPHKMPWNRPAWQREGRGRELGPSFLPVRAARPGVQREGPSPAQPDTGPAQDTLKTR